MTESCELSKHRSLCLDSSEHCRKNGGEILILNKNQASSSFDVKIARISIILDCEHRGTIDRRKNVAMIPDGHKCSIFVPSFRGRSANLVLVNVDGLIREGKIQWWTRILFEKGERHRADIGTSPLEAPSGVKAWNNSKAERVFSCFSFSLVFSL